MQVFLELDGTNNTDDCFRSGVRELFKAYQRLVESKHEGRLLLSSEENQLS